MKKLNTSELLSELFLLIIVGIPIMLQLGILTLIGYVIAVFGAIRERLLFRKVGMAWLLIGGMFLSYIAGQIFPMAFVSNNIIGSIIILILAGYIWLKGYFWRKGKQI